MSDRERPPIERTTTLTLPRGLVGHSEWRRFSVFADSTAGPLIMLESLDDPDLFFLAIEPHYAVAEYFPEVDISMLEPLDLAPDDEPMLLCLLTVHEQPARITANLLGPLVVNPRNGYAVQVVLSNSPYSARHEVCPVGVAADGGDAPCSC
ncbi:MAG: flagellar assembly protein FliW [Anaerolineae bacterium]